MGRSSASVSFPFPYDFGGLNAIHFRHLHIHEDQIKIAFLVQIHGFLAINRHVNLVTHFLEHVVCHLSIDVVVLHEKDFQRSLARRKGVGLPVR